MGRHGWVRPPNHRYFVLLHTLGNNEGVPGSTLVTYLRQWHHRDNGGPYVKEWPGHAIPKTLRLKGLIGSAGEHAPPLFPAARLLEAASLWKGGRRQVGECLNQKSIARMQPVHGKHKPESLSIGAAYGDATISSWIPVEMKTTPPAQGHLLV